VVGIIRDFRGAAGDTRSRPELYIPFAQNPIGFINLIVRSPNSADPRLRDALRAAVAAVDPSQVVDRIATYDDTLLARVAPWRLGAWLLGTFAAIAVVLAAIGLAASMAWWVTQRTREIGVRMALGANPQRVRRIVLGQGLGLAIAGVILGLAGAAASTRLLASWLYGVEPLDPKTFAASAAGILAIAALASYIPARRATRIDPIVALREQ
jgi:predicted lysophospholipase L1 biosynthesis ABC-type transport system permease subunit